MNTFLKGKLTKLGLSIGSLTLLLENLLAYLNSPQAQHVITAGESTASSIGLFVSALTTFWGGLRATFNYGEK